MRYYGPLNKQVKFRWSMNKHKIRTEIKLAYYMEDIELEKMNLQYQHAQLQSKSRQGKNYQD